MIVTSESPLSRLVRGSVVVAGDAEWDAARATFNVLDDQQPTAIAFPVDASDVAAIVAYAREHGLRVAAQATGHNARPLGSLDGTILLHTSRLAGYSIDAAARRVRVGAATKWESITDELSALGLAGLHGSSPDVGIVGYSLGGGMGWLARRYGLQTNSVTAFEMVTADGRFVRTDAEHDPDLFWALRGGGGNFGVVTAVEFEVYPVDQLYAGVMFFPIDRAAEVLRAWAETLPAFPDELMSWTSLLQFPDLPEVPEPMRGGSFAVVYAAFLGDEETGRRLLAPVRRLGPVIDTFAMVAPAALGDMAMDPPDPLPYLTAHQLLTELPVSAIDDIVAAGPRPGSPLVMLQLRHMGGALARATATAGARATLPGEICALALGVAGDAEEIAAVEAALEHMDRLLAVHRAGDYPNFVEEPADTSRFFDAETWQRLRTVKALYDPEDVFKGNHHVPPAA